MCVDIEMSCYFDKLSFDVVVHDIDALSLLALVQVLLGNLELTLGVVQLLLYVAPLHLDVAYLLAESVLLAVQLMLPEVDVIHALA